MTTMFDIGDLITVNLIGKVLEYRASKDGDCYTIELTDSFSNQNRNSLRVYLETNDLKHCSARRITSDVNNESTVKCDG